MRKLIVTCPCGQKMQVPRSAYGKVGLCPKCGQKTRIGSTNSEPMPLPSPEGAPQLGYDGPVDSDSARQRFGQAVDYFCRQRFAESLALLDDLAQEFPGNQEIAAARRRCMEKLRVADVFSQSESPNDTAAGTLDAVSVQSALYRLMTRGSTDEIRLRATELACRMLNLLSHEAERPATKAQ